MKVVTTYLTNGTLVKILCSLNTSGQLYQLRSFTSYGFNLNAISVAYYKWAVYNTPLKFPSSTHTHKVYISIHIIMHISTRTCYIHHKRGVTEVWHMAHFWVSYGRCTMPGSPMGRSEGLSRCWTG